MHQRYSSWEQRHRRLLEFQKRGVAIPIAKLTFSKNKRFWFVNQSNRSKLFFSEKSQLCCIAVISVSLLHVTLVTVTYVPLQVWQFHMWLSLSWLLGYSRQAHRVIYFLIVRMTKQNSKWPRNVSHWALDQSRSRILDRSFMNGRLHHCVILTRGRKNWKKT